MRRSNRVTIQDISNLANVSIKTVSRVLNDEPNVREAKRVAVMKAARKLGYKPNISARQLASNRSFILVHFYDNPNTDYLSKIYDGMRTACHDGGYYAVAEPLHCMRDSYKAALVQYIDRYQIDGAVLSPPISDDRVVIRELRKRGIACALISPAKSFPGCVNVFIDEAGASQRVTDYLLQTGHRKLAFVSGLKSHSASANRGAGFWAALKKRGLPRNAGTVVKGDFSMRSGFEAFDTIARKRPEVTGVVAANDEMAIGVMVAALRAGKRIPEDLSVVGFDDSPFAASMWPSLTTIAQPVTEMAKRATDSLIAALNAQTNGTLETEFPTEVRIRQSCR